MPISFLKKTNGREREICRWIPNTELFTNQGKKKREQKLTNQEFSLHFPPLVQSTFFQESVEQPLPSHSNTCGCT